MSKRRTCRRTRTGPQPDKRTRSSNKWGEQRFYNGRLSLEWDPTETLTALFTLNGFWDKGQSQMPQVVGITPSLNPINAVNPLVADYPRPPRRADAASWGPCREHLRRHARQRLRAGQPVNRLYDDCHDAKKNNKFYSPSLHVDYNLTDDMTLTSLTSYNHFERDQQLESDGTIYQDYESSQDGKIETVFQELRIAGSVSGKGSWVFGANYEHTRTWDSFLQTYGISTAVPTQVITATPLGPTESEQSAAHRHLCAVRQHRVPGVGHDHADRRIALHEPAARLPRLRLRRRRRHLVAHLSGDSDRIAERATAIP